MQYMFNLKNSATQVLWWLIIFTGFYLLLEKSINRFCHGIANLNGLEERQLWLNTCNYWPTHKNSSLQTSQGYN